uniref:Leucine zipper with capping helix domain-containing protein n=1 Tax=Mycena chlorophos TaxID=658473 RepID=A0ABQ0M2H9_MYCCL|nr:predicted protein [Mycena chlorophos]
MAPRGLSADEKRVRLLELFHETKDFYQLKELEKARISHSKVIRLERATYSGRFRASAARLSTISSSSTRKRAHSERVDTETRQEQLAELARLRKTHAALLTELELYGACNPVLLDTKRRSSFLAHEAASRWTDNFGILMGHCTQTLGADSGEIRQSLGIEDTYDDI